MFDELAAAISEPHFVGSSVVPTRRGLGHREFHALLRDRLLAEPEKIEDILGRLATVMPTIYGGFNGMPPNVARDLANQHIRLAFTRRDLPEPLAPYVGDHPKPLDRPERRAAIRARAEGVAAAAAEAATAERVAADRERRRVWAMDRRHMPDPRQIRKRYHHD